jgi:CHAT domain-containing protein
LPDRTTSIAFNKRAVIVVFVLPLWLVSLTALGQAPQSGDVRYLPPNQMLRRELMGAETHRYKFNLKVNEFFQVRVEQKGIDVMLKLLNASNNVLATMDSPNGKEGPETLSFVAGQAGSFALEVSGLDAKAGKGGYSIRREESHAATAKDRRRVEVERLFAQGMTALGVKGQVEAALEQLREAWAGWEELADDYMGKLTASRIIIQGLNEVLQTAQTLLSEGQELSTKSKADSLLSREKLNEALKLYQSLEAKASDPALVERASRLGEWSQQTLNYLKAFQHFSKLGKSLSLNGIAQTYWNLGDWQENVHYQKLSLAAYEDAIKFLTESSISGINQKQNLLNLRFARASALESLGGTLNTHLEKPEEALKYLNQALEQIQTLFQETQDPQFRLREALTFHQIGSAYTSESKNRKKGIEFFSKAIEIYRTLPDKRAKIALLLISIGAQYSLDFNYEAALKNWDEALEIYRELDNKAGQISALQFKGSMYYLLDNKPKVRETFNQVLPILQSPDFGASFKKALGSQSVPGFEIFNELDDGMIEEIRLDRIGFAYQVLENYEKSIEYYEKALAITWAQKDATDIRSELRSIGFIYTKLEKWDKAAEYADRALKISREGNVKEDIAFDLTDVGFALLEAGKPKEALKYQNEALALFQSVGIGAGKAFSLRYSPLLNDLGRTHAALGNRPLAIFYGKQGINAIQGERQRLSNFDAESQKGFLGKKEKHYRRLASWLIEEGRLLEAEQVLAMLKREEVFDYLRRDATEVDNLQQRADLRPEERDALRRYKEIADKIAALGVEFGTLQELQSKGVRLTAEQEKCYNELSAQIEDASHAFQVFLRQLAEEFAKRPNTEKDLQENLALQSDLKSWGEGVVFLYTLTSEDRYRVILVTPDTQVDGKYEIKAKDLNDKIEKFRAGMQNPTVDPRLLGKELYDILIKPIEKQLDGAKATTLLWSLDGSLRLLPLAALWDGKEYFGQKYQNVTITLASRTRLGDAVAQNWRALGLGVSEAREVREPNGTRELKFPSLPAVRAELRSIVQSQQSPDGVMPGQSLLDEDFTESALESQLLRGYKVVHIASHFSLNPGDSTRSFLLLGDGNFLTVDEMKNNPRLGFRGVELLTLSACQTGMVEKDSSGKEIEGFGYVAQQKGAKAILATLWSVADESTQLLMSEFYRLRKDNPQMTKAAALQMAQQEMIVGKRQPATADARKRDTVDTNLAKTNAPAYPYDPKKPYAHPYYWSPFVLIGNWR